MSRGDFEPPEEIVEASATEHDLDGGDLTLRIDLDNFQAAVVAANSVDGNNFTANVRWLDGGNNVYQTEIGADIGIDTTTEAWARLVKKGEEIEVTFSDDSAGGTTNRINAYLGGHV